MGLFVWAAFLDWRRADAERVEALDGLVNRWNGWFDFLEGMVRRLLTDATRGVEEKPCFAWFFSVLGSQFLVNWEGGIVD